MSIKIELFGSSHGEFLGAYADGLPAGFRPDLDKAREFMLRRAPGQNEWSSARRESDEVIIEEGMKDGVLTGERLKIVIKNSDVRTLDYDSFRDIPRPGHADLTAFIKFGSTDTGKISGRMCAPICFIGAIILQFLAEKHIFIGGHVSRIGDESDVLPDTASLTPDTVLAPGKKSFPVYDDERALRMKTAVISAKGAGDTLGGSVRCYCVGIPAGLGGDDFFSGAEAALAEMLFAVPAVKGVSFGDTKSLGSENNDEYYFDGSSVRSYTNNHGGILGGITSGMPLVASVDIKPTPSIRTPQRSVNLRTHESEALAVTGRHDPCIAVRAVPVIEACMAIGIYGLLPPDGTSLLSLRSQLNSIDSEIAGLLAKRFEITDRIGVLKNASSLSVLDESRERAVLDRVSRCGKEYSAEIEKIYKAVMSESRSRQNALKDGKK